MFPAEDLFIRDEEVQYCPLCVEEMDISDKHFKPCPCGYQICQFCYNNIRQNPELNGRCPGCRRLYDDESVEYRALTAEEYKLQQVKKERRDREKKQREKEKKELELSSKKHLAGLRVVQKNLVYVTGLSPPCPSDDLHSVLRSDKYFGQYGKIQKIVVNRKLPADHALVGGGPGLNLGIVVYVTFTRKDDALKCINELDGSLCDGRVLRAAYGTTKYCLSYLRSHLCPNPNCMFLHEPGEEADSYTMKDLSTHQGIKMGMSGLHGLHGGCTTNMHHLHLSDDDNPLDDDRIFAASPLHVASNVTPSAAHATPILPATAHWAKAQAAAGSPNGSPTNVVISNAAAFPTLGEISKGQKTQRKDPKKLKNKASKDDAGLPDDVDLDDLSVAAIVDECSERLRALSDTNQKLKVHFDNLSQSSRIAPFFHFDETFSKPQSASLAEEKVLAIHVIEKFLFRPMKKYHLAYLNHTLNQQEQFLQQQQVHLQQQQQANLQEQAQGRSAFGGQGVAIGSVQETGSSQMMQQLQQHQNAKGLQPQVHVSGQNSSQGPQLASQLNVLRLSERSNTSTPPPPGLFTKSQETKNQQQGSQGSPSSSSQLLKQLMRRKK